MSQHPGVEFLDCYCNIVVCLVCWDNDDTSILLETAKQLGNTLIQGHTAFDALLLKVVMMDCL
eukprot:11450016-Ditylum_brightwellii.AAC.1